MKGLRFVKAVFILFLGFIIYSCERTPFQPEEEEYSPVPVGIHYFWKYSYHEQSTVYKTCEITSSVQIDFKKAYVVNEKWIVSNKETSSLEYAWQWDDPYLKIFKKLNDDWEPIQAFCLFDSGMVKWGYHETSLIEVEENIVLPYNMIRYQNCYEFKSINLSDSSISYYSIKKDVGFIKQELDQTLYLVEYKFPE